MANTILTPELLEKFAALVRDGNYFETCCNCVGVSRTDAYNWLSWGQEGKQAQGDWPEAYVTFFDTITRASAEVEAETVKRIRDAGGPQDYDVTEKGFAYPVVNTPAGTKLRGDLKANLEFLARRFGERWGNRQEVGLHGTPGKPPVGVTHGFSPDVFDGNPAAREAAFALAGALFGAAGTASDPGDGLPSHPVVPDDGEDAAAAALGAD